MDFDQKLLSVGDMGYHPIEHFLLSAWSVLVFRVRLECDAVQLDEILDMMLGYISHAFPKRATFRLQLVEMRVHLDL